MYVSTHEAGALYLAPLRYPGQVWDFKGYEVRKGIKIGTPRFPKNAFNLSSGRPVLFAAKGSHGLWTLPGQYFFKNDTTNKLDSDWCSRQAQIHIFPSARGRDWHRDNVAHVATSPGNVVASEGRRPRVDQI
jgi:hypothetical protein